MSPTKFISRENRAHPIGTLSWHSHQCAWHFALPPTLSSHGTPTGGIDLTSPKTDWTFVDAYRPGMRGR